MILWNNQLKDFNFNIFEKKSTRKNKEGEYNIKRFCDDIFTFDIETTSAFLSDGKIIPYEKGKSADYWNNLKAVSLCYIWQFSVNETVYYSRNLRDFYEVLDSLPKVPLIIWVHNLAWEFQFLFNIITWSDVFARTTHKPIKASCAEFPHIEFRCSYTLTRLSLAKWGDQIGLPKMVGDLDYDKMRTPLTPLTDKELQYCARDCEVVYYGIKKYLEKYERQDNIPLTQTGTVRRVVKDMLMCDPDYVKYIKKLVPHSAFEYMILQKVFAGGYAHANRFYAGTVVDDEIIEHYDYNSSYPYCMFLKMPMTPWYTNGDLNIPDESTFDRMAYIMELEFEEIESVTYNTYIQASKVSGKGLEFDNGRIISAKSLKLYVTELDYYIIKRAYKWKNVKAHVVYRSYKGYLPKELLDYVLILYENKTRLDGVVGMEELYLQSKQYINSLFGMSVTALIQSDVKLEGDQWSIDELTVDKVEDKLASLRNWSKYEKRYFMSYSWGIYIANYGRYNLWRCILKENEDGSYNDHDTIYCDTDSIFIRGVHDFSWYDKEVDDNLKACCDYYNLDFKRTRPVKPNGKIKQLGYFGKEKDLTEFITLGAKRYCMRDSDGKLSITVSGINKGAVELLEDDINNFRDGFNFDKDADCVTKKLATYITDQPVIQWPDGYISDFTHGINLRRTGYVMELTDEYKNLINYATFDMSEVPDTLVNHMRGKWYNG